VIKTMVRTLKTGDVDQLPELINVCNRADGWAFRETIESLDVANADPSLRPERYWQIAEEDGRVVGLAALGREKGTRLYSMLWVLPERRGTGLERRLVDALVCGGRPLPESYLDLAVRPTQPSYAAALEDLGFSTVRTWYVMRIELGSELPKTALPPGVEIRSFAPGQDEGMLTELIDDCFWDHWGEGEHTLQETEYGVHLPVFDRELLLFAEREAQVLGYCWSWIEPARARVTGDSCAYIGDLGVRPAFRHQGVGRALLLRSLDRIKSRGATAAELDMDGPNEKARQLYESVGFSPHIEVQWYRRPL